MKAVITVIGQDKVGIISSISKIISECNANILDISQTIMDNLFTMVMYIEVTKMNVEFTTLSELLEKCGKETGLDIRIQHEDIFKSMHRI
jgi:ACT domain-containing protein